ncbi:MAG: hypothetical protein ACOC1E_02870, partial [Marinilabiliaceae bacterium]
AGNFGFRGMIGLNGLDLFVSFWGNAKKKINEEIKNWSADILSRPNKINLKNQSDDNKEQESRNKHFILHHAFCLFTGMRKH